MTMCVTGFMASGKNVVCDIFESLGWQAIDADIVVHDVIKKLTPKILAAFSDDARIENITLANEDGSLNRRALGQLIFGKPELLARQENIVYPEVIDTIKKFCKSRHNAIINATVLYKTPELMCMCDAIVFVTAPFFTRLRRAMQRDKIPLSAIIARFKSQRGLLQEYKTVSRQLNISLHVVKNSGSTKRLEDKIKKLNMSLI